MRKWCLTSLSEASRRCQVGVRFCSFLVRVLVLVLVFALIPVAGAVAANGDYLSPDLRARVDKLKADVAYLPTDSLNLEERTRTLWQWANAYALNGGELPVNLTQAVARVFAYPELALRRTETLDALLFEMALLDTQPDAIGTLRTDPGPFEARQFVTIRQTYTVGNRAIQTGGGFLIARHFMPNYGIWQTRNPKDDNYISIISDNPGVSFTTDIAPMSGMHGGFRTQSPSLVFRLATGVLEPDDEVTITYGDTTQGSRGFQMASFSSDRMPLPIYLAFNEAEPFLTLPIQPIKVTGTTIAAVHGFAPSIVEPNEPFILSIRAEDAYYNRARDGHPRLKVLHNDRVIARLPASDSAISLLTDLSFDEPGAYHLKIVSTDGRIQGEVNPILVTEQPSQRIYWGDTHGHSGFAEGVGTPERFMVWARDDARLDYVTHSEHDIWLDDQEWEVLRENVKQFSREGEFIAYLGYEWTVNNLRGGHHNVLFRTPNARSRIPAQFYPTLSQLYAGLRAAAETKDVVVIPHAHQAGDYRQNDPELEPLIEIMSQHGNFEWFGRMYLTHGHQVGFVAASDNHLSQPGYTAPMGGSLAQRGGLGAILATEKTTDAIFDAMKDLRTYATTGERMILDVSLNGAGMGQRTEFSEVRRLRGRVIGTAPIESITVVKNDEILWSRDYLTERGETMESGKSGDRLQEEETLLLSFASDSTPYHPNDNPRGWRHWRGTLTVENAEIEAFRGMDFHASLIQSITRSADTPNQLEFTTLTRGDTSSIELTLSGVKRSTTVNLVLEPSRETGGAPPLYRPPQETPGTSLALPLKALVDKANDGRLEVPVAAGDYTDRVILRRRIHNGPLDVSFELEDRGVKQGDYYFVRVRQANDAMAWSSPIWVGGYGKR
jgi:hypothetical protein